MQKQRGLKLVPCSGEERGEERRSNYMKPTLSTSLPNSLHLQNSRERGWVRMEFEWDENWRKHVGEFPDWDQGWSLGKKREKWKDH